MKHKTTLMYLLVSGLMALAAGCGKTENAAAPTSETDKPTSPAEPAQTTEKPATQPTNAVAALKDTAKPMPDATAKPADMAVPPVKQNAPQPVVVVSPAVDPGQGLAGQANTSLAMLPQDQVAQGLKAALAKGLQQAVASLGQAGGFLSNANVRIPMPEKMQKVESALRTMKQDKLADDFVTTMNHAAETAVPEAGPVFADALKQITIADAKSILTGTNNAATQYFQRATQTNLYARFYPIVKTATEKTGATAAYKNLMDKANVGQSLGSFGSALGGTLLGKDSLDIDAYVTNKALDGLFKMVAEQEQQIRQNPAARTTELLQKVFGALKK